LAGVIADTNAIGAALAVYRNAGAATTSIDDNAAIVVMADIGDDAVIAVLTDGMSIAIAVVAPVVPAPQSPRVTL
jgi:hypothetical protein